MFNWKDDFSINVPEIDLQHKKLFEIGNRAAELLTNDYYTDKYDKIVEIINELKEYTIFHFKSEEAYMLSIKYKKYFGQKVAHDDFIKKINSVNFDKIDNNQDKHLKEILAFISEWTIEHILAEDKLIGQQ